MADQRAGDGRDGARPRAGGVRRRRRVRVPRPCALRARPLPRERHHGRVAHRRAELRATPTRRCRSPTPSAPSDFARQLASGGVHRVLAQSVLAPNFGPVAATLDRMDAQVEGGRVASFKAYTAWGPGGRGYSLTDPAIGLPVVQRVARPRRHACSARTRGCRSSGSTSRTTTRTIWSRSAAQFPDMQFVVFHSGVRARDPRGSVRRGARGARHQLAARRARPARHPAERERVLRARHHLARGAVVARPGRARPRQAARRASARTACSGAPTRSGTARRSRRSWRCAPSRSRPSTRQRYGYPALTPGAEAQDLRARTRRTCSASIRRAAYCAPRDPLAAARPAAAALHDSGLVDPWRARGPLTRRQALGGLAP